LTCTASLRIAGELPAVRDEVQDHATIRLFREADAREQHLNQVHPDRNGFLNRVQAMTEAQNVVMREIVLVPPLDADETSTGSNLPQ
jgi:hypothetical protein